MLIKPIFLIIPHPKIHIKIKIKYITNPIKYYTFLYILIYIRDIYIFNDLAKYYVWNIIYIFNIILWIYHKYLKASIIYLVLRGICILESLCLLFVLISSVKISLSSAPFANGINIKDIKLCHYLLCKNTSYQILKNNRQLKRHRKSLLST